MRTTRDSSRRPSTDRRKIRIGSFRFGSRAKKRLSLRRMMGEEQTRHRILWRLWDRQKAGGNVSLDAFRTLPMTDARTVLCRFRCCGGFSVMCARKTRKRASTSSTCRSGDSRPIPRRFLWYATHCDLLKPRRRFAIHAFRNGIWSLTYRSMVNRTGGRHARVRGERRDRDLRVRIDSQNN